MKPAAGASNTPLPAPLDGLPAETQRESNRAHRCVCITFSAVATGWKKQASPFPFPLSRSLPPHKHLWESRGSVLSPPTVLFLLLLTTITASFLKYYSILVYVQNPIPWWNDEVSHAPGCTYQLPTWPPPVVPNSSVICINVQTYTFYWSSNWWLAVGYYGSLPQVCLNHGSIFQRC